MKPEDSEIKKACKQQNVPSPSEGAKKLAVQRATEEFIKESLSPEKKSKGFPDFIRRMGKTFHSFIYVKGEPIMTQRQFATVGIAVIALGFFLTLGPRFFLQTQKEETELDHRPPIRTEMGDKTALPEVKSPTTQIEKNKEPAKADLNNSPIPEAKEQTEATLDEARQHLKAMQAMQAKKAPSPEGKMRSERSYAAKATVPAADAFRNGYVMDPAGGIEIPYGEYYQDTGRDKFTEIRQNPVKLVTEEPVSTFSVDVDTASYSFMRRQLNNGILPQKDAVRVEELINYFSYNYPVPQDRSQPFQPTVAIYPTPWNSNTKLLHIGIKGYDIIPKEKPRSNLVFLIDVSGSMNNPNKLPLLKNSFAMLVDTLQPQDTVAIVVYAGAAGTVLEPTKVAEKGKILAALNKLKAGGSTAGGEGIQLAYSLAEMNYDKNAVNRVILATDGDFNVGITNQNELKSFIERKRKTGIFLSVLGFGQGNYNDSLMQTLAQNGNGNAAYIDTLNEARKVLVDEAGSTLFPIAKDVKIQIEFNPAKVHEYRLIGYETRLLKREDFRNDLVDAGDIGSGHSVTAIYEITPVGSDEKFIEGLRYNQTISPRVDTGTEYAFLKIRYKLPDEDTSRLISLPVTIQEEVNSIDRTSDDIRFACAVSAFGQLIRNDPYTGKFSYDDVITLAESARGRDKYGYRSEFLNLVRLAKTAKAM